MSTHEPSTTQPGHTDDLINTMGAGGRTSYGGGVVLAVIGVLVLVAAMLTISRFVGPTEASANSGAVPDRPFAPSVRLPR
jgi:hypothetical protein